MSATQKNENGSDEAASSQATDKSGAPPHIRVVAQYIKDLSFENLATPESLGDSVEPEISVQFNMNPARVADDIYGLMLELDLRNKNKTTDKELFILELVYYISLRLPDMAKEQRMAVLIIEGGRLAFPSVRHIVRELIIEGGFPAFNLEPIDFVTLYRAQMQKIQAEAGEDV